MKLFLFSDQLPIVTVIATGITFTVPGIEPVLNTFPLTVLLLCCTCL